MPAYVVVDIDVKDHTTYERYKAMAGPAGAAYGGRYLVRGGATQTCAGTDMLLVEGVDHPFFRRHDVEA